jgi:hypothetical protein
VDGGGRTHCRVLRVEITKTAIGDGMWHQTRGFRGREQILVQDIFFVFSTQGLSNYFYSKFSGFGTECLLGWHRNGSSRICQARRQITNIPKAAGGSPAPACVGVSLATPSVPHPNHILIGEVGEGLALVPRNEGGEAVAVNHNLGLALAVAGHGELVFAQNDVVFAAPLHRHRQRVLGASHTEVLDPFTVLLARARVLSGGRAGGQAGRRAGGREGGHLNHSVDSLIMMIRPHTDTVSVCSTKTTY